jgi:transcriptional regulator GlxA family with amidase domain
MTASTTAPTAAPVTERQTEAGDATAFNIAFVLFPDFEELDFVGPFEVFGMVARYFDKTWRPYTVAETPEVRAFHGMRVGIDYTFADAPPPDLICVPGGRGTRAGIDYAPLTEYIRAAGEASRLVTSVCTGALLLHRAGFLDGKRATTHWGAIKELRELGGTTQVVEGERWVHDGGVITSAGVSAGIDMALYVVGLVKSPEIARSVQRAMEYEPAPPYQEQALPS